MDSLFDFFIPVIVLLAALQGLYFLNLWVKKNYGEHSQSDKLVLEHKKEVQELKDRVSALEKIVTEDQYDLKREFDKLDAA